MKATVDQELCVGCGLCADSCPEVFKMENEKAIGADSVAAEQEECANKMVGDCPVEAIKVE